VATIDGRSWLFGIGPVPAAEKLVVLEIWLSSGGSGALPHRRGCGSVKHPLDTASARAGWHAGRALMQRARSRLRGTLLLLFSCLSCYSPPRSTSLQFLQHPCLCHQCATNHRWPTSSHSPAARDSSAPLRRTGVAMVRWQSRPHATPRKWTARPPAGRTVRPARRPLHQKTTAVPRRLNAQ